jgi:hypothetical protein
VNQKTENPNSVASHGSSVKNIPKIALMQSLLTRLHGDRTPPAINASDIVNFFPASAGPPLV